MFDFYIDFRTKKKICLKIFLCGSGSALHPDSKVLWIRIRNEEKCWIRIESIRIHNPNFFYTMNKLNTGTVTARSDIVALKMGKEDIPLFLIPVLKYLPVTFYEITETTNI
jgi:hypothetical protein